MNLENFDDDKPNISHAAIVLGIVMLIVFGIGIFEGWKFAASIFG